MKTLKKLCELRGISGREESVSDFILSEILPFCDAKRDNMGNILAFKKGKAAPKKKLMLCAHTDEVGMLVTSVTDEGYLKFSCVGGIDPRIIFSSRVFVGDVPGVIGGKPIHMIDKGERGNAPGIDDMYIDIGAKSKEEALSKVNLFSPVTFDSEFTEFGDGKIKARALDDRAGCAILIDLIKKDLPYDMHFAFTVQEEVGLRGAKTAAYTIDPDIAIIVEATTAADIHGIDGADRVSVLDEGPVLSFMDNRTIYDKELFELALKTAESNNIKAQVKSKVAGGNDAGAVHTSRGGVRTLAVSLPCRYLHSPVCVISKDDYESTKALLDAMLDALQLRIKNEE